MNEWMCRAAAFELLALGFLPIRATTAEALANGEFADACVEALEGLGCAEEAWRVKEMLASYSGRSARETFHDLRREHTRLFVGEREPLATPYIGVWSARQKGQKGVLFVGKETMAIEQFMAARGIMKPPSAKRPNEPADHIGSVCEFVKYLCLVNARAIEPAGGVEVVEGDCGSFLADHVSDYSHWLSGVLSQPDRIPFYQALGCMMKALC